MEIRPDIKNISVVKLTTAGECMLMAYTPGTIETVLNDLKVTLNTKRMRNKHRWNFLSFGCRDKAKEMGIKPNYSLAKQLLDKNMLSFEDIGYQICLDEKEEERKEARQYTKEEWKDAPEDRRDNANMANGYEEQRPEGDMSKNPYFTWLYPSWKVRMFEKYPHLKEIHARDWAFCKSFPTSRIDGSLDKNTEDPLEAVERICKNLSIDSKSPDGTITTKEAKRMVSVKDPWFDKLTVEHKAEVLTRYPFYADIVGLAHQRSFFEQMHQAITSPQEEPTKPTQPMVEYENEDTEFDSIAEDNMIIK